MERVGFDLVTIDERICGDAGSKLLIVDKHQLAGGAC